MTNDARVGPDEINQSTYENDATARRVEIVDDSGNPITLANPLPVEAEITVGDKITIVPGSITGRTFKYEDASFVTGDSPVVLDVNTDLGRNSVDGYIANDGTGSILVEISNDGSTYGGQHTLKAGEIMDLASIDTDSIRITWVSDSAYRILVV